MSKAQTDTLINQTQDSTTLMAVFKNGIPNCRYNFKNGKEAIFTNGEYLTNNESEIKELMEEISTGHPHISIDKENAVRETKYVDPVTAIRAQLLADLRAQGMLIEAGNRDMGTSDQNIKMNLATTRNVADAMIGVSTSQNVSGAFPIPAPANVSMTTVPAINTIGVDSTHPHVEDSTQNPINMSVGSQEEATNRVVTDDENKVEQKVVDPSKEDKDAKVAAALGKIKVGPRDPA